MKRTPGPTKHISFWATFYLYDSTEWRLHAFVFPSIKRAKLFYDPKESSIKRVYRRVTVTVPIRRGRAGK